MSLINVRSTVTGHLAASLLVLLRLGLKRSNSLGDEDGLLLRLLLQGILSDGVESLLDVQSFLGTGLEVGDVSLGLAPSLNLTGGHLAALGKIGLVSEDNEREGIAVSGGSVHEELIHPALKVVERLGVGDVVHKHTRISTTVKGNSETLETLLTGGIPNL